MDFELKFKKIHRELTALDADAILLAGNMNLYYTTGRIVNGYFSGRCKDQKAGADSEYFTGEGLPVAQTPAAGRGRHHGGRVFTALRRFCGYRVLRRHGLYA